MILNLVNQSRRPMPRQYLQRWVQHLQRELSRRKLLEASSQTELTIVFLSEPGARELNKKFRGKDYATDVLSFSCEGSTYLGELVLCPEVVEKQAQDHGLSFRDESAYLVLHGLLHLLGFEHERGGAAARKMYALQDNLFDDIDKIK